MSARFPLCTITAAIVIAIAAYPWIAPSTDRHHAGLYAVALMLGIIVIARRVYLLARARSIVMNPEQSAIRADAIAGAGGLLVGVAALAASLLAPETKYLLAGPETRIDVPYHAGCTVRFPALDETASPSVNCTKDAVLTLPGGRAMIGGTLLTPTDAPVFRLEVRDAAGARQTVTRPQGGGFLAPVFVFARTTSIAGADLPSDAVAVPAEGLRMLGFFLDETTARSNRFARLTGGRRGVLLTVQRADGAALPHGIAFLADDATVTAADLRIGGRTVAFPALYATSVGAPFPTLVGVVSFLGGLVSGSLHRRRYAATRHRGAA